MKLFRIWAMAFAVGLAACADGEIQSPDFTPVVTITSLTIEPASPQSLPAGTTVQLRAFATWTQTVPPGTRDANGNPVTEVERGPEDVTNQAQWASSSTAVATVDTGTVRGVTANPNPVTITAAFGGRTANGQVTVTDAVLVGIEYVKPEGFERTTDDSYTVVAGSTVPFEIYGRFTDNSVQELDQQTFDVGWTSGTPGVANNANDDNVFTAAAVGAATITGQVSGVSATPDSADATLNVSALNEFCASEFIAPSSQIVTGVSAQCLGCSAANPELVIDGDLETFASLSISLGLLDTASVSVTPFDTSVARLAVGQPTGFVVSRAAADLLSLELLSGATIETVQCNADGSECTVLQMFEAEDNSLGLTALGTTLSGNEGLYLLFTDPLGAESANANGVRLTFAGGLVSALASLGVNTACGVAIPPEPAE
jgi:hypothetical protein